MSGNVVIVDDDHMPISHPMSNVQSPSPARRMLCPELPHEIILRLIEILAASNQRRTLAQLQICSKRLYLAVTPLLFKHVRLTKRSAAILLPQIVTSLQGDQTVFDDVADAQQRGTFWSPSRVTLRRRTQSRCVKTLEIDFPPPAHSLADLSDALPHLTHLSLSSAAISKIFNHLPKQSSTPHHPLIALLLHRPITHLCFHSGVWKWYNALQGVVLELMRTSGWKVQSITMHRAGKEGVPLIAGAECYVGFKEEGSGLRKDERVAGVLDGLDAVVWEEQRRRLRGVRESKLFDGTYHFVGVDRGVNISSHGYEPASQFTQGDREQLAENIEVEMREKMRSLWVEKGSPKEADEGELADADALGKRVVFEPVGRLCTVCGRSI